MHERLSVLSGVLVAACALLALGAAGGKAVSEGEGPVLEVLTFNLRWGPDPEPNTWDSRRERVVALLRRAAPDVVGLQESRDEYVEALLSELPGYAAYPASGERANTILYRAARLRLDLATSDAENARVDAPEADWGEGSIRLPRCARFVERRSGVGFYVYNNHLDHRSAPSRQWSVEVLLDRVADRAIPDPVILTGDFNAKANDPAIRFLVGEAPLRRGEVEVANATPFVDALRAVDAAGLLAGTFHRFLGVRVGPRVDYVFAEPDVAVRTARIHRDEWQGLYPSDHFPVSATLVLPPAAGAR